MGSSKGKDILFFGIFGAFMILSQIYKLNSKNNFLNLKIRNINRYLKITIILSFILAISGIFIEIKMRNKLGINLSTIFASLNPNITSTSILHSHIYKSVFGEIINNLIGSFIPSGIHLGNSLFPYIPQIAIILMILFPIIFILMILSLQKRSFPVSILLSFFSTCTLIGILDGGFFSVPAITGLCGLILVYRNEYYINLYLSSLLNSNSLKIAADKNPSNYDKYLDSKKFRYLINRLLPYLVVLFIVFLRFSITIIGANPEYYEVNIENPNENIDLSNDYNTMKIIKSDNETIYLFSPEYNEMELFNDISHKLEGKSEYMSISWNGFSYL
ncbi:MAG: hypothetical protein KO202_03440 [Methanobacteriaceae archaeon]|nr:hypothetical protein [Methanobacteriaceae archaeon]